MDKITANEVKRKMDEGEPIAFVDTRNPNAWSASNVKLPGAIRILAAEAEQHLDEVPRDRTVVTYCT